MPTKAIIERTDEEIVVQDSSRVFRPVSNTVNVPDSFSGQYVTAVGVVTNVALNDAQEAQLQTAIEAIAGVQFAKVLVGSSRLSHDRMPADTVDTDYKLLVRVEMGIDVIAENL